MYKKMLSRLLILSSLIMGIIFLAQPATAALTLCEQQCLAGYRSCVHSGAQGCDLLLDQCTCNCPGNTC